MTKPILGLLLIAFLVSGCSSGARVEATSTAQPAAPIVSPPAQTASALPACAASLTPAQMEGPYYKAGSPERSILLEPGIPGEPLLLTGVVVNAQCEPIAGARIDFWQADGAGAYDNAGYRLRGHQTTSVDGSYRLETVVPGVYPGRTPHIHVKIFAPDGRELLTTQLYFTGVSDQVPDSLFEAALLARDEEPDADGRRHVSFDFVVRE